MAVLTTKLAKELRFSMGQSNLVRSIRPQFSGQQSRLNFRNPVTSSFVSEETHWDARIWQIEFMPLVVD